MAEDKARYCAIEAYLNGDIDEFRLLYSIRLSKPPSIVMYNLYKEIKDILRSMRGTFRVIFEKSWEKPVYNRARRALTLFYQYYHGFVGDEMFKFRLRSIGLMRGAEGLVTLYYYISKTRAVKEMFLKRHAYHIEIIDLECILLFIVKEYERILDIEDDDDRFGSK